jgi:predicted peroxiredoxin
VFLIDTEDRSLLYSFPEFIITDKKYKKKLKGVYAMADKSDKLVIVATHAEESPDKATIPFVMGNAALAMDVKVTVVLQVTAVYLAMNGYADHVHAAGFPPLSDLLEAFFEAGGEVMVCSPCLQARKIGADDLIPQATIIAGATLVSEVLSATNVVSY